MKTVLTATVATLAFCFTAHAAELRSGQHAAKDACNAAKPGITRTAFVPAVAEACCVDQLRCTQLLATTTIERQRLSPRT